MNWYDFLLRNRSEVLKRSVEHIGLVAASMAIALAIGLPLGIALVRRARLQRWVLGAANVVQTIPSLALFGFLIPVPWIGGVGASTAIVALALYALAADFAQHLHGHRGRGPGGDRSRARHGHDAAAGALASAASAGRTGDARGNSRGDCDFHWRRHDCGGDWRGRTGRIYFSRRGHGQ